MFQKASKYHQKRATLSASDRDLSARTGEADARRVHQPEADDTGGHDEARTNGLIGLFSLFQLFLSVGPMF